MPDRPPGVAIRRASVDDAEAIAATLEAAFGPLRSQYTRAAYAATVPTPDVIQARLAGAATWVAVRGGGIVGTVTARPTLTGVYVQSMAVAPSAQGLGIGRSLLREAAAFASDRSAGRLYLSTTPFLHHAIRLYEAEGFRVVPGEGPSDLHGTPLVTMERPLEGLGR